MKWGYEDRYAAWGARYFATVSTGIITKAEALVSGDEHLESGRLRGGN